MEWISTNDKVPKDLQIVIISNGKDVSMATFYKHSGVFALNDRPLKVTHWMPLPEPPKS